MSYKSGVFNISDISGMIVMIPVMICLIFALSGCGKKDETETSPAPNEVVSEPADTGVTENTNSDAGSGSQETAKPAKTGVDTALDITSETEIRDFLRGDWKLYDPIADEDFATLSINSNGDIVFTRDKSGLSVEGHLNLQKHSRYDEAFDSLMYDSEYTDFELSMQNIPVDFILPGDGFSAEEETIGGYFHIARGDGEDFLSMNWVGNGDSFIFAEVFQNEDRISEDMKSYDSQLSDTYIGYEPWYRTQDDWLFHRSNDGLGERETVSDESFYGWIWSNDDDRLQIQTLDLNSYETEEEYTSRRFKAGYFTPKADIGADIYELNADSDLSLVIHTAKLDSAHPLMMCEISADASGNITSIRELPVSFYGLYDMGDAKQEFSYEGMNFTINDVTMDLTYDYDSVANAIMDMYQVGSWIVIETHVNPHHGIYYLYNIYTGQIEKAITGANLTWVGDDITTAVYSDWNQVFDFKENCIGWSDGAEIQDLAYNSAGTQVTVKDMDGNITTIKIDQYDKAMYAYADYQRHQTPENWKAFAEMAPEDSIAYVCLNPPYETVSHFNWPGTIDESTDETCYIVALKDDVSLHIDLVRTDPESGRFTTVSTLRESELDKSYNAGYYIGIAEGIPEYCLYVSDGTKGGKFPISVISGEHDQRGAFIKADMTAKEVQDTIVYNEEYTSGAAAEFDAADAYMDLLFKYKEAQDNAYTQEQVEELGLDTELIQHAWPWAAVNDEVKYEFIDIDGEDPYELVITYLGYIIDIYGSNGKKLNYAYGTPYRGEATLYSDGMLEEIYAGSMDHATTRWYRYDPELADFMPVFEQTYDIDKDKQKNLHYYMFPYESDPEGVVEDYKQTGTMPVYAWEWDYEITEEEYRRLCSAADVVDVSGGTKIADFKGL